MELLVQPPAKTPALPAEIWMHVAQFVLHADLCSMFTINRVFFKLSMDARYREFKFGIDSAAKTLQRLQRVRDPLIAHRVRHLYVNLECDDAFLRQFNEEGDLNPGWTGISLLEWIQIMTETVTCLTSVTEFSVQWTTSSLREHQLPFLIVAWKSFGSRLRKLSFKVSLNYLAALLSTADGLVALRDLDVTLTMDESFETQSEAPATALALFINKVAPTLHSLSFFTSLNDVDLSPCFHRLEKIPNLERLSVDSYGSPDSFSTTRFLCNNATTLRHLHWNERHLRSRPQRMMDLRNGNTLAEVFSNLCTLQIIVPGTSSGLADVVQHLRYSAVTLTSLVLPGYYMTFEEVNSVISIFTPYSGGHLKELGFRVKSLSPELILLLAQMLPCLEILSIGMFDVTGHDIAIMSSLDIFVDNDDEGDWDQQLNAAIFAHVMRTYDFHGWQLRDIEIKGSPWPSYLHKKLMWVLAECVPSVRKFSGKEKELYAIAYDDRL